jgi:MOSC domain-containing protein YiiM
LVAFRLDMPSTSHQNRAGRSDNAHFSLIDGAGAGATGVIVGASVIFRARLGGWREIAMRAVAGAVSLLGVSRIVSVNLAVPEPNPAKGVGVTGINKRPVDHLVTVRAPGPKTTGLHSGLVGDQIFDIEHHGGDDQAVYAYAREDYDWWQARLSRRLANGLFGENLTTEEVDVNGAVIGERWRIGPRLVLQPTFGRIPCVTFQRKMGEPRWVKTFARANRPGAYLRVLEPGEVWAGDPVIVEDRPAHGVTIAQAFRAYMTEPQLLPGLVEIDGLPDDLRETLAQRLLQRR